MPGKAPSMDPWFSLGFLVLVVLTSVIVYLVTACKIKQQNLIRIRNSSGNLYEHNAISTVSGPGGIIQPDVRKLTNNTIPSDTTIVPIDGSSAHDSRIRAYAKPLIPPYPPIEPVTIVKGLAPTEGYRQTDSYTDIVVPPGFIQLDHSKL
ncbi:hypothetical protein RUM44_006208 [Polyplax serrata]|uniref:Uncharacterized protein n=1 Tax=Polyplax serrata TaxID=468196 RepID=A0ABR1AHH1_POLSC